jgi:hypothetical protein
LHRECFVERIERGGFVDARHAGGEIEAKGAGETGRRAEQALRGLTETCEAVLDHLAHTA